MIIIYVLFYDSSSLSSDVSWEYIAKLLVSWLYDRVSSRFHGLIRACISDPVAFNATVPLKRCLMSPNMSLTINSGNFGH